MDLSPRLLDELARTRAKVRVGYAWWLRPFLLRGVIAITLGRTIHVSAEAARRPREVLEPLLRHELAHVRQIRRLGLPRFLGRYAAEFVRHWWRTRSIHRAYSMISLEAEAMAAEREGGGTGL